MYLVKTPKFIQSLFPNFTWSIPTDEKVLYLTFDDGPIPEITPWVLETLADYGAKATFFCVGNNVRKHGKIYQQILDQGHDVGNHTQNHVNGWGTEHLEYLQDVSHCSEYVNSPLFRPPYGRMRPTQAQLIQQQYKIVMWDILSGDFDKNLPPEQCLGNVILKASPGSIVVFHDSLKAEKNLKYALPRVLDFFSNKGYSFEAISSVEAISIAQAS